MSQIEQVTNGGPDGSRIGRSDDKLAFYGGTPATQPTATALTALATTTFSAAYTGMWAFASSTAAKAVVARVNQLVVDIAALKTRGLFG